MARKKRTAGKKKRTGATRRRNKSVRKRGKRTRDRAASKSSNHSSISRASLKSQLGDIKKKAIAAAVLPAIFTGVGQSALTSIAGFVLSTTVGSFGALFLTILTILFADKMGMSKLTCSAIMPVLLRELKQMKIQEKRPTKPSLEVALTIRDFFGVIDAQDHLDKRAIQLFLEGKDDDE